MKLAVKIYRGYANENEIIVFGHVFKKYAPDVFDLDKRWYKHAWAVIRMFSIKTVRNLPVTFTYNDIEVTTKTLQDGYFRFSIPYTESITGGWHNFKISTTVEKKHFEKTGEFIKPHSGKYGIISDIDDTFLISHSGNIFKKLYVLLTKNIYKRHFFEDVIEHYRFLHHLGQVDETTKNAFFYVSSSEWNLYNFIIRFTQLNKFPKAVLKLKEIKRGVADFLFTGSGNHHHKFHKIKHLVEFYPELHFILLGDDTQKDPEIYENICKLFPKNISTVYIRKTKNKEKPHVLKLLKNIRTLGVETCYFSDSAEAFQHSQKHLV